MYACIPWARLHPVAAGNRADSDAERPRGYPASAVHQASKRLGHVLPPRMLTWVLLPESFAVKVGLYRLSTGALLSPEGLTANAFTMYPRLGRGYALDSLFFFLSFCPSAGIPSLQTVCPSACVLLLTRLAFHRAHRSGIGGAIHGFSQAPVRHSGRPALV